MFLDPEPKRQDRPGRTLAHRPPLRERTAAENNQQFRPTKTTAPRPRLPPKTPLPESVSNLGQTVRLVAHSSSPASSSPATTVSNVRAKRDIGRQAPPARGRHAGEALGHRSSGSRLAPSSPQRSPEEDGSVRRRWSAGPLPQPLRIRKVYVPSLQDSDSSPPSSPYLVVFDSDSTRARSVSQPTLRLRPSVETFRSRTTQSSTLIWPESDRGLTTASSFASLLTYSTDDTLPSLRIPKRRRQQSQRAMGPDEVVNHLRRACDSHLSTIASESDRDSRIPSQLLPAEQPSRSSSARPPPLFIPDPSAASPSSMERGDTVSELPQPSSPSLRPKRSGYSSIAHSNSTSSRSGANRSASISRQPSVSSTRSSIFPAWAIRFYGGTANLVSPSAISVHLPAHFTHTRQDSQWTERSITSRLGTGYDELGDGSSPTSSHFLPSIFRSRTRTRANTSNTFASSRRSSTFRRPRARTRSRPGSYVMSNEPMPPMPQPLSPGPDTDLAPDLGTAFTADPVPDRVRVNPVAAVAADSAPANAATPETSPSENLMACDLLPCDALPQIPPEKKKRGWGTQRVLFCVGFIFPLVWIFAGFLLVKGRKGDVEKGAMLPDGEEVKWRWRNRLMGVVGFVVLAVIVSLTPRLGDYC
ncbi:hypothetical protein K470DRAFT_257189 [Piedraia hortae CBS 480.64]|uniref:Uncharacterized protein n=1 Tax=Piedraia hortae CBS 480.64 TaxID=1314780 RepID=A0A6A7C1I6_9PEZI|nr:hypothetical protein K470DRAFT_257189 [Piedraia hortae CBS 480.64]